MGMSPLEANIVIAVPYLQAIYYTCAFTALLPAKTLILTLQQVALQVLSWFSLVALLDMMSGRISAFFACIGMSVTRTVAKS